MVVVGQVPHARSALSHKDYNTSFLYKVLAAACLGGILFGYDLGVVSGALPQLTNSFGLKESEQESVVGVLYIGAAVGSAFGGIICDFLGRKLGIMLTDLIFVLGAVLLSLAYNLPTILAGRFVVGFAVSVSGICDVSYLTEMSPSKLRGAMVSCNEACISLGFLISYLSSFGLTKLLSEGDVSWRLMFGLSGVIAIAQFCGMCAMPESPLWLATKGRHQEAEAAYARINNNQVQAPMDLILQQEDIFPSVGGESSDMPTGQNSRQEHDIDAEDDESKVFRAEVSFAPPPPHRRGSDRRHNLSMAGNVAESMVEEVSASPDNFFHFYPQVVVLLFLATAQQFCGHGNMLNFAPELFSELGIGSTLGTMVLLGVIKFFVTVVVIINVDALGRRMLLVIGTFIIALSMLLLMKSFGTEEVQSMSKGLAMMGTVGVVTGYAVSFGPLTWLVTSEMFPSKIRGRALGLSAIVTAVCAYISSYTLLSGMSNVGKIAPFILYFFVSIVSMLFFLTAIPDTREKSPQQIDTEMRRICMWRFCVRSDGRHG